MGSKAEWDAKDVLAFTIITTNSLWYYNIEYPTIIYNIITTNKIAINDHQ
jgi:hypothetical protein